MLRLSPADRGRLQDSAHLDSHVAGAEANVACALASLGVETAWVSALPENPLGRRVARSLQAAGVDLSFVAWEPEARLGLFFIEFGAAPRPTSVWYDRADSAFSRMTTFDPAAVAGASYAVTSGITLAVSEATRKLASAFIAQARLAGASICIDVNYRERLCSERKARLFLEPALAAADLVVCSRRDAARVFELQAGDLGEVASALRDAVAPAASHVVITDGDRGCAAVADRDAAFVHDAMPAEVVDKIGAGDAFLAGLLWGLLDGAEIVRSLDYACALGALAVTVRGDQAVFTPDEVRAAVAGKAALIR
jgi:2-dehydro-3-deoxygluconokinase